MNRQAPLWQEYDLKGLVLDGAFVFNTHPFLHIRYPNWAFCTKINVEKADRLFTRLFVYDFLPC